jgi:hypothetical protein
MSRLLGRQGTTDAPAVLLGAAGGEMGQEMLASPAVFPEPSGEHLDGPDVVVQRLLGGALGPHGADHPEDAGGRQVGNPLDLPRLQQAFDAVHRHQGVHCCVALGDERLVPLGEMLCDRPVLMAAVGHVPSIDEALAHTSRVGLGPRRHRLGGPAVGATPMLPLHSSRIGEAVIPDVPALADVRHRVISLEVTTIYTDSPRNAIGNVLMDVKPQAPLRSEEPSTLAGRAPSQSPGTKAHATTRRRGRGA